MNYEDLLQQKIVIWYKNEYQRHEKGLIFAIPNGGSRNVIEAKKLKAVVFEITALIIFTKTLKT